MTVRLLNLKILKSTNKQIVLAFMGSLIIALSAQIVVPTSPVPMTMQTYAVLLVGGMLGARLGFYSAMLYLVEGACGLPVFAGFSSGLMTFIPMKPSAGYLIGMPVSAWLVGHLVSKIYCTNMVKYVCAGLLGLVPTYVFGILVLAMFCGNFDQALSLGLYPFIGCCSLKVVLFASTMRILRRG